MKQNVVDVLMFLFENIITDENQIIPENEQMFDHLENLGFPQHEIVLAFDWLEDLADVHANLLSSSENNLIINTQSVRIFSELEKLLLDTECISFLTHLEQTHVITDVSREVILDRVIALDVELNLSNLNGLL